jgi:hypothetical protein
MCEQMDKAADNRHGGPQAFPTINLETPPLPVPSGVRKNDH